MQRNNHDLILEIKSKSIALPVPFDRLTRGPTAELWKGVGPYKDNGQVTV